MVVQTGLNVLFVLPVDICANVLNELELSWQSLFWHQNQYHSSHNFYFLEIRDGERTVFCSLPDKISMEASPSKN